MGKLSKISRSRKHKKIKHVHSIFSDNRRSLGNLAPVNDSSQEPPKSFKLFLESCGDMTHHNKNKKSKPGKQHASQKVLKQDMYGMTVPLKSIPTLQRRKYETERSYIKRISNQTNEIIRQSQLENSLGIKVKNSICREISIPDSDSKSNDSLLDQDRNHTSKCRTGKHFENSTQKRNKSKRSKKLKKTHKNREDFLNEIDKIEFGETVHAPPSLTSLPRAAVKLKNHETANDKSKYNNLLFMKTIEKKSSTLSLAEQSILKQERKRVIQVYRDLKKKRVTSAEVS